MTPDPAWIGRKWAFSAWKWSLPPCTAPQPVPGRRALCICTVSDSFVYPDEYISADGRETSFTAMMEVALDLV